MLFSFDQYMPIKKRYKASVTQRILAYCSIDLPQIKRIEIKNKVMNNPTELVVMINVSESLAYALKTRASPS